MTDETLLELLDGNHEHTESIPDDHFADVQDAQHPDVVSVCCSDSRISQEGMWAVEEPGWLFTPSNIGNQAWDEDDGELVVNGNLLYPVAHTDTKTMAVVGHTGCGAVTATYQAVTGDGGDEPAGIAKWVRLLTPVVEDGLDSDAVNADADDEMVVNQLVEYNVDAQVEFLRESEEVPNDANVYGFVYDFQGVYGDVHGRTYLTNLDGETDTDAIADALPDEYNAFVQRLLD
ncbi:MAG TPA: carbonic anhydrase [Natrialbaceae archaeon]|nr:carbonic anhydrase [Natrialbaceae archaeon]